MAFPVVVVGLATDYCVKETALDAVRLGFDTVVLAGLVRASSAPLGWTWPAVVASYRPVVEGGWSGLEPRAPAALVARRSASALTAAREAATVSSQRRATTAHQYCPARHRSAPISPS